jgi:hypothetical protein
MTPCASCRPWAAAQAFPAPRRVRGLPFFRIRSATAWTTLALTINADGSSEHELAGGSPFPRHWIYDTLGNLLQKSGTVDFKRWYRESHGDRTPWGDEESPRSRRRLRASSSARCRAR